MARELTRFSPPDTTRARQLDGVPLASFRSRAAALVVDFLLAGVLFMIVTIGGSLLLGKAGLLDLSGDLKFEMTFFDNWYSLIWLVLYFGGTLYLGRGQTPGKRLFRIRVVSIEHESISLLHAAERALGYGASTLEFGLGFFQYYWSPDRRTAHDRLAGTIVVDERKQP